MIKRTKEETVQFLSTLWPHVDYEKPNIEATIYDDHALMTISKMYEPPGLSLRQLIAISEFFGVENVDDIDKISCTGCDTCDYGSEYGFTLKVW